MFNKGADNMPAEKRPGLSQIVHKLEEVAANQNAAIFEIESSLDTLSGIQARDEKIMNTNDKPESVMDALQRALECFNDNSRRLNHITNRMSEII